MKLQEAIQRYTQLDEQLRAYFQPRLVKLLKDGVLNKGRYNPKRTDSELVNARDMYFDETNNKIVVSCDIWWGGDVYDYETISLTEQEWENVIPGTPITAFN